MNYAKIFIPIFSLAVLKPQKLIIIFKLEVVLWGEKRGKKTQRQL